IRLGRRVMKEQSDTLRTACNDFEEDLVLYYYGDSSESERIGVQDHLQTCSSCREILDDLRKLLPQMAKPNELPAAFRDTDYDDIIEKLVVQEKRWAWWKSWFVRMRTWMMPAFGTAVVAALAIGLVISRGHWHYPFSQTQEQIPQEIL